MLAYRQVVSAGFSDAETKLLALVAPTSQSQAKAVLLHLQSTITQALDKLSQSLHRLQSIEAQKHQLQEQRAQFASQLAARKQRKSSEVVRLLTEEITKLQAQVKTLAERQGSEWRLNWKSELPRPDVQKILEECEEEKLYLQNLVDAFHRRGASTQEFSDSDWQESQPLRRNEALQQANDMLQYKLKCSETRKEALRVTAEELTKQLQAAKRTIEKQAAELAAHSN